jgi:hypothetical protein
VYILAELTSGGRNAKSIVVLTSVGMAGRDELSGIYFGNIAAVGFSDLTWSIVTRSAVTLLRFVMTIVRLPCSQHVPPV